MTMYTTSIPMLLKMIQSNKMKRPTPPYASRTTPEYVEDFDACVNLKRITMDDSVIIAQRTIMTKPGINPSCFTAAGRAMMPAPTIVVERLNTAPVNDEPSKPPSTSSRFVSGTGFWLCGLGLRRLRSVKGRDIVVGVVFVLYVRRMWMERKMKESVFRRLWVETLPFTYLFYLKTTIYFSWSILLWIYTL